MLTCIKASPGPGEASNPQHQDPRGRSPRRPILPGVKWPLTSTPGNPRLASPSEPSSSASRGSRPSSQASRRSSPLRQQTLQREPSPAAGGAGPSGSRGSATLAGTLPYFEPSGHYIFVTPDNLQSPAGSDQSIPYVRAVGGIVENAMGSIRYVGRTHLTQEDKGNEIEETRRGRR